MSNFFCANDKCGCHVDVADAVGAMQFTVNGEQVTRSRVLVKQKEEPDLTLCSVCANVLQLIKLL